MKKPTLQDLKNSLKSKTEFDFQASRNLVAVLRGEGGCPWDREQTHQTLAKHAIEEAYELAAAIGSGDKENFIEELGDNMLQFLLHTQIGEESGEFSLDDVCTVMCKKLISRHTFIFGDDKADSAAEALSTWENNKIKQKKVNYSQYLSDLPQSMSPLLRAEKICRRAAKVGWDWHDYHGVCDKVREELAEVEEAAGETDRKHLEEEVGDLLFICASLARFLNVDGETALMAANEKFIRRFTFIETEAQKIGKSVEELTDAEYAKFWAMAKKAGL